MDPVGALAVRPSGLDLDRLPELSEVFRLSDMVMYGSWQPCLGEALVFF